MPYSQKRPVPQFWRMYIWGDDSQTKDKLLTPIPIWKFSRLYKKMPLNSFGDIEVDCIITDPPTGEIGKGTYFAIYGGENNTMSDKWDGVPDTFQTNSDGSYTPVLPGQDLWATGYITQLSKTVTRGNDLSITGNTALYWLNNFRNLGNLEMDFTTDDPSKPGHKKCYRSVMDALNGLNLDGTMADPSNPTYRSHPHHLGILSDSGWRADWTDGTQFDSNGNLIKLNPDTDFRKLPGYGDSWLTAWESVLLNLQTIASHYNLWFRERPGSKKSSGVLEFGRLNDSANLSIYGGDDLANQLGVDATKQRPSAYDGFKKGLSVITGVAYSDDFNQLVNTAFGLGVGAKDSSVITISSYFPPVLKKDKTVNLDYYYDLRSENVNIGTVANPKYVNIDIPPNGRNYWALRGTQVSPIRVGDGKSGKTFIGVVSGSDNTAPTYQLIAVQNQHEEFSYGIVNLQSAAKYGIVETMDSDKKVPSDELLLESMIGDVELKADPVPTWTVPVKHPRRDGNRMPPVVKPGQVLDIHYTGAVHEAIDRDPVSGQFVGVGDFQYLHFPTQADIGTQLINGILLDQNMFNRMRRVIQVEEEFSQHGHTSTYTMGAGKLRGKHWNEKIAQKFEKTLTAPPSHQHRHLKKGNIEDIPFLFEYGAHIRGEDAVYLPVGAGTPSDPGAIFVSDVKHAEFFDDHHSVSWVVKVPSDAGTKGTSTTIIDFWFAKPITSTLADPTPEATDAYGIFRMAWKDAIHGTTNRTGFYIKAGSQFQQDHGMAIISSPTFVGRTITKDFNHPIRGLVPDMEYAVHVTWSDGTYKAFIKELNPKNGKVGIQKLAAIWTDRGNQNSSIPSQLKYITDFGAIGWRALNGTGQSTSIEAEVRKIHALPLHNKTTTASNQSGSSASPRSETVVGGGGHAYRAYNDLKDTDKLISATTSDGTGYKRFHKGVSSISGIGGTGSDGHPATIFSATGSPTITFGTLPGDPNPGLHDINLIKGGYTLYIDDGPNSEEVIVSAPVPNKQGTRIMSVTLNDVFQYAHTDGTLVRWDHMAENDPMSHGIRTAFVNATRASQRGYAQLHYVPGNSNLLQLDIHGNPVQGATPKKTSSDSPTFIIYKDGTISSGGNIFQDGNGNVFNIGPLAVKGEHIAKGWEHQGVELFSAGEYDSKTQKVYAYSEGGTIATLTGPMPDGATTENNFFGGSASSADETSGTFGSWLSNDIEGLPPNEQTAVSYGDADAILQLTTTNNHTTVVWQDTQILDEVDQQGNIQKRSHKFNHDVSIGIPVMFDTSQLSQTLTMGNELTADSPISNGDIEIVIHEDIAATTFAGNATSATPTNNTNGFCDVWEIALDQTAGEEVVVLGFNTDSHSMILSKPIQTANNPQIGGVAYPNGVKITHSLYKASVSGTGYTGGTKVNSGNKLDGTHNLDDLLVAADAITIGFLTDEGTWHRGWWGDTQWTPPHAGDNTNYNSVALAGPLYQSNSNNFGPNWMPTNIQTSTEQKNGKSIFHHLGSLAVPNNITQQDWHILTCKAHQLGLYDTKAPKRVVGVEVGVHAPSTNAPVTVFFDAHEIGQVFKKKKQKAGPPPVGIIGGPQKTPYAFTDGHVHSDLYVWAQRDKTNPIYPSGSWMIHWEHDTPKGANPGQIIMQTGKTSQKYSVHAGPRQDGLSGSVSELHPNYGIPAIPFVPTGNGNYGVGVITGSDNKSAASYTNPTATGADLTDQRNIMGSYLVFNPTSTQLQFYDPGVVGNVAVIPAYNSGSGSQQTGGFGILTEKFNWNTKKSGSGILHGPSETLIKIGKIVYNPDPHTGELPIYGHALVTKKHGKGTRKGTLGRGPFANNHPAKQKHHGIIYKLNSTGKSPNHNPNAHPATSPLECTFHANLDYSQGNWSQIETHDGEVIGRIRKNSSTNVPNDGAPLLTGNQYINHVRAGDYVVFDDGVLSGLAPGYYCMRTNGGTFNSTFVATSGVISQGPCFNAAGTLELGDANAAGLIEVGRVSPSVDHHTKQFYFQGHHPASIPPTKYKPGSVGKGALHKTLPSKKKKRKKTRTSVIAYTPKYKKSKNKHKYSHARAHP